MANSESRFETLVSLAGSGETTTSKPSDRNKREVVTRKIMISKLRELEYNSLAVALESGTINKLDPTSFMLELRNLRATLHD